MKDWWHALTINTVTTAIISVLLSALPPAGVLYRYGRGFIGVPHPVPGWVILSASVAGGLLLASVWLNIRQWLFRRRVARRTLTVVAEGHHNALHWTMGKRTAPVNAPVMTPCGDFLITNVSSFNVTLARAVLLAKYRVWRLIPRRRRVDGPSSKKVIQANNVLRDRLIWFIEPPILKKGQTLRAKVGLVDNLGQVNWSEWRDWSYW